MHTLWSVRRLTKISVKQNYKMLVGNHRVKSKPVRQTHYQRHSEIYMICVLQVREEQNQAKLRITYEEYQKVTRNKKRPKSTDFEQKWEDTHSLIWFLVSSNDQNSQQFSTILFRHTVFCVSYLGMSISKIRTKQSLLFRKQNKSQNRIF